MSDTAIAPQKRSKPRRRRRSGPPRAHDQQMVNAFVMGRAGYHHIDYRSDIRQIDRWIQSWVYICIERNAVAVSQQVCRMYRRGQSESPRATKALQPKQERYLKAAYARQITADTVEVEDHPFLRLLERPNPMLDNAGLWWLTVAYLQAAGQAIWHLKYDSEGLPIEIWPLPVQYVVPIMGHDAVVDYFEFRMGGRMARFSRDEVAWFRKPSPIDTISAFGNLRGTLETAEIDIRMLEYERAVFENMAVPDILISAKGDTTGAQLKALEDNWRQEYKGHRRRGMAAAVPFPIEVTQLSHKNRELEFDKGHGRVRDKLGAGFGIPIPILTATDATFSNMAVAVELWMRNGISPLLNVIAATINHDIMLRYSPTAEDVGAEKVPDRTPWFIAWDNPVPEDLTSQSERDVADVTVGIRTVNEIRHERNLEPLERGDEPLINGAMTTLSMIEESQRFDQEIRRLELEQSAATDAANAADADAVTAPAFGELTTALQMLANIGDLDGVNLVRGALADQLGGSLSDVTELAPAPSGAVVEPGDAAERPQSEETDDGQDTGRQEQDDAGTGKPRDGASSGDRDADESATGGGGTDKAAHRGGRGTGGEPESADPDADSGEGSGDRKQAAGGVVSGLREVVREGEPAGAELAEAFDRPGWVKRFETLYTKVSLELTKPEHQDKSFEAILAGLFQEFEADVLEHLNAIAEKALSSKAPTSAKDLVKALFVRAAWIKRFADAAIPSLLYAFRKGAEAGALDLQRASLDIERLTEDRIEKHVRKLAESFASVVVDLTGAQLAEALIPGLREGENITQLAKRVGAVYGQKKDPHAMLIARTEVNSALNAGAAETFSESGIKQHEWLASAAACEFCVTLDGKVVPIGQPFAKLGGSIAGARGGTYKVKYKTILYPTLHPQCTCTIVPVIE